MSFVQAALAKVFGHELSSFSEWFGAFFLLDLFAPAVSSFRGTAEATS